MMEAAGLALSAWQVRLRGSPARRLTTGPPLMTGFSGGTGGRGGGEQEVSPLMTSEQSHVTKAVPQFLQWSCLEQLKVLRRNNFDESSRFFLSPQSEKQHIIVGKHH